MKIHVLTAAVIATLASGAALAASEGGDTWSEVQAVQQPTYSVLRSAPHAAPQQSALDAAFKCSEGGDTWSSLQAVLETRGLQAIQDHPDGGDARYIGLPGGSEGGDTWSRFVLQFQSQAKGSRDLASRMPVE